MKKDSLNTSLTFYQKYLHLQESSFTRIEHEDAIVAVVYKITPRNGKELILKICDRENDYLREVYFLKLLAKKILTTKILQLIPPQKGMSGAILMEYLPGDLLKPNALTESLAFELGRTLAHIHLNRLPGYGDPIQDQLFDSPLPYFTYKFEEGLEECKSHLSARFIEIYRRYYESHLHLLSSVDGPCVIHRDFRPGNMIVLDHKLQGIIDWAGARASFAEEDFCSIEHGDWLTQYKQSFLSGYAEIRPVPNYNRLIPFLRLNKVIATMGYTVKQGTWKTRDHLLYQFNRQFLETFVGEMNLSQ